MQHFFFDSSGLVKRYIPENGTSWIRTITNPKNRPQIVISELALVEISSAVARRTSERRFTNNDAQNIIKLLMRHASTQYFLYPMDDEIIAQAQRLCLMYAPKMRSLDSIQLASAIVLNREITAQYQPALTFVCADTRLLTIAQAEGLVPINPNLMPP